MLELESFFCGTEEELARAASFYEAIVRSREWTPGTIVEPIEAAAESATSLALVNEPGCWAAWSPPANVVSLEWWLWSLLSRASAFAASLVEDELCAVEFVASLLECYGMSVSARESAERAVTRAVAAGIVGGDMFVFYASKISPPVRFRRLLAEREKRHRIWLERQNSNA